MAPRTRSEAADRVMGVRLMRMAGDACLVTTGAFSSALRNAMREWPVIPAFLRTQPE
jgi:hypothetical protein